MARKGQVSIQDNVETNEEFQDYLIEHMDQLICMEVYSDFCGPCLATNNAIRKGKLEIGQDRIAMGKALADKVDVLARFRGKSEPVFLFIVKGKLTRAMFGANGIELCRIIEEELAFMKKELETGIERPKQPIEELLPEESEKIEMELKQEEEARQARERIRILTLAARKKRVAERMAKNLTQLNFILYWPHCHQAHVDLYEKWDLINIQVGAKETIQLTEAMVPEALYMSDVEPNEACVHALLSGEVLVVLFKMFDTDTRNFVKLLRYTLYEEIPIPKEDVPPEKQVPLVPAYERYAAVSKTVREVRRERYEAKLEKLRLEKEEQERLAAEQARLAREAEEERLYQEKKRKEEERMARIQAGLPAEPEPEAGEEEVEGEGVGEEIAEEEAPEKVVEEEEVFHSDVSVEGEDYIPPGGLFVPGLYAPPNELAKANGLAFFFPKVVQQITTLETEHLPPHVLVIFSVDKRHEVRDAMKQFPGEIIQAGIFMGEDPYAMEHVAFTIKQYDQMTRLRKHRDRLALMVSRKRSNALLTLAGLNPCYISSDLESGERDCLAMFPVGYGDEYVEEESVVEEEQVVEVIPPSEPEPEPEADAGPEPENEDDDEEDHGDD
ncbi:thioredoxin domain-containing protein 3 homolog [Papilio machaon]|uniref:thioredoxin domain-containing protein 3 homolog n=1 Tax=Papilio machaon TaxID=76193 RepID=UPI001E66595E|nr:thioredoxin domain-containing protein 3 homolog [Papilio machaon]